jgi:hypothetical protein
MSSSEMSIPILRLIGSNQVNAPVFYCPIGIVHGLSYLEFCIALACRL